MGPHPAACRQVNARQIIGLDLSLTATGFAADGQSMCWVPKKITGMERLQAIRDMVTVACDLYDARLAVVEGYSMGSRYGRESAGELGGIVRLALYEAGVAYVDVAPTRLKKYATNKGNAGKDEMLAAAIHKLKYEGHDHNEADALWLRQMALVHYGFAKACKTTTALVEKIEWPVLDSDIVEPVAA